MNVPAHPVPIYDTDSEARQRFLASTGRREVAAIVHNYAHRGRVLGSQLFEPARAFAPDRDNYRQAALFFGESSVAGRPIIVLLNVVGGGIDRAGGGRYPTTINRPDNMPVLSVKLTEAQHDDSTEKTSTTFTAVALTLLPTPPGLDPSEVRRPVAGGATYVAILTRTPAVTTKKIMLRVEALRTTRRFCVIRSIFAYEAPPSL